jgi:hypothetical protein
MARYGKVIFSIEYTVDIDDAEMIEQAREMLAEDVADAIRYREVEAAARIVADDTATEADIHDYLIECRDERRRNPSETLSVPADMAAALRQAIDGPATDYGRDECIFDREIVFGDGRRMAIQVVTTNDREGAWTQGVLFSPEGGELGCTEPGDSLEGEYCVDVEDEDGTHTYTVTVEASEATATA